MRDWKRIDVFLRGHSPPKGSRAEGSITVFLSIVFLLFFSLVGAAFEQVRILSSQTYMHVAASSAAATVFGKYNRELYQEYGLYAYGGYGGRDEFTLQNDFSGCLEENLACVPENPSRTYVDLYRFAQMQCQITDRKLLTDMDAFCEQVEAYLKSEAVGGITDTLFEKGTGATDLNEARDKLATAKDYEEGKYDSPETEGQEEGTESAPKKATEEELEEDSAGGNPLKCFSDMMRDGILGMVCDQTSLSKGEVEPYITDRINVVQKTDDEDSTAADYLEGMLDGIFDGSEDGTPEEMPDDSEDGTPKEIPDGSEDGTPEEISDDRKDDAANESGAGQGILRKIELITYGQKQFSRYGEDKGRTTKYGLEYLAAGKKEEKDNLAYIVNRLLALRLLVNFVYVVSDGILQEKSLATATLLAGFTGMPPVITAVQYTILLILAFQESCVDITALLMGKSVPAIKNRTNFKMRYEEICLGSRSLFQKKAATIPDKAKGDISYEQYLFALLVTVAKETLSERMLDLIQYDLRQRFNQSFSVQNAVCMAVYHVDYQMPFLFSALPYVGKLEGVETQSVEVSYSYEG